MVLHWVVHYGVKVTFNDMTSLQNFMKIYQLVQKLGGGQTHRQNGDLISLRFSFRKENRLKIGYKEIVLEDGARGLVMHSWEHGDEPWRSKNWLNKWLLASQEGLRTDAGDRRQ
jgi:hypothetical protein